MNKLILETILHLYALIARIDGLSDKDVAIAKSFLTDHVNDRELPDYIRLFHQYVNETSDIPTTIQALCAAISGELPLKQKHIIIAILTELVLSNEYVDEIEESCMLLICKGLQVDAAVFQQMKRLLTLDYGASLQGNELLISASIPSSFDISQGRYIQRPGMQAAIVAMHLADTDLFFFRLLQPGNDLLLNGQEIEPKRLYPFQAGSVIRGERIRPIFFSEWYNALYRSDNKAHIIFEAQIDAYYHNNGIKGLENVHIAEESGTLIAIMGPSGSGKSTLLNVLNGTKKPSKGYVTINGIDIHKAPKEVEGLIGYVPQDDLLLEDLTVFENLYFSAQLCYKDKTKEELEALVLQTLKDLNLEDIADKKVGNVLGDSISGGQRKRVNIGLELLRKPAILFSDEPTSGLSSRDSEKIMELHRELASMGKIVFVVIHQPSSDIFKMFDKLFLIDKGGLPIYYGSPTEAVEYFKNIIEQTKGKDGECAFCGNLNPEQIFNIVETPLLDERSMPTKERKFSPQFWHSHYKDHIANSKKLEKYPILNKAMSIASPLKQLLVFFKREALSKIRNTQFLIIGLLQAPFLALILGIVVRFYDQDTSQDGKVEYCFADNVNVPTFLFMSVIVALFTGMAVSAEEIIKDARIRKREAFLNLNQHSYLLAKITILFIFSAIQTLLFVWVGNSLVQIKGLNTQYFLILFSTSCFANLLGLNVSASFKKLVAIYIMIPVLLIPQLVMGGTVIRFSEINPWLGNKEANVPLLGDLMASRWAFEALAVTQFKDNPYESMFYEHDKLKSFADFRVQFLLTALQTKIDALKEALLLNTIAEKEQIDKYNTVLAELREEERILKKNRYIKNGKQYQHLPTRPILDSLERRIQELKVYYGALSGQASRQRDAIIKAISNKYGKKYLEQMRMTYRNNQLEAMLRNNINFLEKPLVEYDGKFIQLRDPIYQYPEPKGWWDYRSKFYLPIKHFAGRYFPTLYFNVSVIWLMTFVLYITLYFEVFKKFGAWIERNFKGVSQQLRSRKK
jgi:ABC-type multidrug transport system ATPase subunit